MATVGTTRQDDADAGLRTSVLAAATEQMLGDGFDGLSVEAVAARVGVPAATVRDRWRDSAGLVTDMFAVANDGWTPPDTGSLLGDLTAMNREIYAALIAPRSAVPALIAASVRSVEVADVMHRFVAERYQRCAVVVRRAIERGELATDIDPLRLLVMSTAPVYHQLLLPRETQGEGVAELAARDAVAAFRT